MKKSLKLLSILLTLVLMCGIMLVPVYGDDGGAITDPSVLTHNTSGEASSELLNWGNKIYGVVFTVGIVLSVIVIAILGIKYMMGSTEDKSEYKKSMMPYLVGAICVFAASTIATIVFNMITK